MSKLKTYPKDDGFFMPAEFSRHSATILIWPERPGSWGRNTEKAECAFSEIIRKISENERVIVAVSEKKLVTAKKSIGDCADIYVIDTDDSWARDTAPTFVVNDDGKIRGIDWCFNAWGGEFDGLYKQYEKDNAFAESMCKMLDIPCYDAQHFVLEGGSVHSDGEGTVLVTEACLLSGGRNPHMTKSEIEINLKKYLGAEKIIWLPNGIYNDETNEHVDNVCAFTNVAEVVLAWTDNKDDPQYKMSEENLKVLLSETDAKGRKFIIHKLPIPDQPVCITEKDCEDFEFEDGEDVRSPGERLAASYVNFYFANNIILMPVFGGENKESDLRSKRILQDICKDRKVISVDAETIIKGGGNIHCITQQIPLGNVIAVKSQ